jgi:putative PEP-CTERM system histidine kinase
MELVVKAGTVVCAVSYLFLLALTLMGRTRAPHITWLIAACFLTALWAVLQWPGLLVGNRLFDELVVTLEVFRTLSWVGFLAALAGLSREGVDRWLKGLLGLAVVLPLGSVFLSLLAAVRPEILLLEGFLAFSTGTGIMLLEVVGLLILENLYRNAGHDQRWGTLYLCVGIALFFVYDFFFYAESLLFKRLDSELADARTIVTTIGAPLIAISLARVRFWSVDLHVSRQLVFHTAALVGAGIYLIAMSLVAYIIRQYGGDAGTVFQITFLALALVLMVAIFSSGSLRSRLRHFIARHFYSSKYDYREEWLRFITTLGSGHEDASIAQRIVWAMTPIVDSTAAALWITDRPAGVLRPAVSWNYGDDLQDLDLNSEFVRALRETSEVIDYKKGDQSSAVALPDWIEQERETWFVVPLVYRGRLHGILLLGEPRSPREFDQEDRNLLATSASQAASYLAEDRAAGALAEARKMEEFNRRFTFVAHDLKNVVNQLSILVSNAARHGDKPEFQRDMVATVANSVDRMKGLMEELQTRSEALPQASTLETVEIPTFDVADYLRGFAGDWQSQGARVFLACQVENQEIAAKRDILTSALNHMVQNALDASGPSGEVKVILSQVGNALQIEVSDNGPGMEADFLENVFFRPFGTTKKGGYGIGGFQIRQQVRDLGAKLEVITSPGQGTKIRVLFPKAAAHLRQTKAADT